MAFSLLYLESSLGPQCPNPDLSGSASASMVSQKAENRCHMLTAATSYLLSALPIFPRGPSDAGGALKNRLYSW